MTDPKPLYEAFDETSEVERYDQTAEDLSNQFQAWHEQLQSIYTNRNRSTYSNQDSTESLNRPVVEGASNKPYGSSGGVG